MQPLKPVAQISERTGFSSTIVAAGGLASRLSTPVFLGLEPKLIVVALEAESEEKGVLEIGPKWDLGSNMSNRGDHERAREQLFTFVVEAAISFYNTASVTFDFLFWFLVLGFFYQLITFLFIYFESSHRH
jgi:hypothetical protein